MQNRSFCYSDIINYDILISGSPNSLTVAKYFNSSLQDIIEQPDDFYVGISQYNIPTSGIPLFIFKVQDNQPNINLGVYSFTMTDSTGVNVQQTFVTYFTQDESFSGIFVPPPIPVQADSLYYYVYDINHMLEMFNRCLDTMFIAYGAAFGFPPMVTMAPYWLWDVTTRTFRLIVQQSFVDNGLRLWTNTQTNSFVAGLDVKFYGYGFGQQQEVEFVLDYTFIFPERDNAYYPRGNANGNPMYLQYRQPYPLLENWYSARSLILMSNLIPLVPTWYSPRETTSPFRSGESNRQKIFEIVLELNPNNAGIGNRLVRNKGVTDLGLEDLLGSYNKLRDIDLQIFWADLTGVFHPLYIFGHEQVYIQFTFVKKSLFKGWGEDEQLCNKFKRKI